MRAWQQFLETVAAQQDFFWFCSLLGWAALGAMLRVVWRVEPVRALRGWLVLVGVTGGLLSLGELVLHSLPQEYYFVEGFFWDSVLNALHTLQSCATLLLLASRPGHRRTALLLTGIVLLTWVGRRYSFVAADLGLLLLAGGLVWAMPAGREWRSLAALAALAPVLATTGVLTELLSQQRRWVDLSFFALPAACWQVLLAGALVHRLSREARQPGPAGRPLWAWDDLRSFLWATGFWLLLGLALAGWTGRLARLAFEASLLNRAQLAAALMDPGKVTAIITPGFTLDRFGSVSQPNGRQNPVAYSDFLVEAARPLRLELARFGRLNPDIYWAHFMTLRQGYLVSPALSETLPAKKNVVVIHGRAKAADWAAWADRAVFFEGPIMADYGEIVRAGAPVISPDGQMLGWIVFELGAVRWAEAQAMARLQTFALTGTGVLLALYIALQRLGRVERERAERAAIAALESDRAKTAFLAKVSHELRTPVQSILGYSELLAGQPLEPEPKRWLGAVRNQGQLLIRLVNDLIDLSALQAGAFRCTPQPANLSELVRGATESLAPRAISKGLNLVAEIGPGVPLWLSFDPERVRQVLLNLVSNAIKFTARGEIRVRLSLAAPAEKNAAPCLILAVQDTGPGISPEDQPRLFRAFSRLEHSAGTEGAGLGLALTAAICESMGGSLGVESDGVHGSTFIVRLPLPLAEAPPAPVAKAAPTQLIGIRVLVADDNPLVRELFATALRRAGAWVDLATDGLEAVELCAQNRFAVVVLDLSMPWLNGLEAARRIRAAAAGPVRLVGVSAHATAAERALALAAGMEVLLTKPVPLSDLLTAVAGQPTTARPDTDTGSPEDLVLLRRFRQQFGAEAPRLRAEMVQALDSSDRRWLRARVHYLKNSADVAGFPEISLLCADVERRAQDQTADLSATIHELVRLLGRIDLTL